MPALLSEHDALHLLRTHCSVLRRRLVFDTSRTDGAVMKQEWMSLLCVMVTDGELASGLGYELRVAIDIVNALCSCWGFSPDRNHRFWRTAVSELWIEYSEDKYDPRRSRYKEYLFQPLPHVMLPFDRAAFSCFAIDFQEYPAPGFEITLAELRRQVTWTDAASKCPDYILQRRRVVVEHLVGNGLVVRPIRVLHLELIVPTNATALPWHSVQPPELLEPEWPVFINAISEIGRETCARPAKGPLQQLLRESASVPTSKHELSIAFHLDYKRGVYLHSSNLEAMQQLLCGCRSVRCITLNVQLVRETDMTDQVGLFGLLLRALLVELKTIKTLRLFSGVTKRAVAPTLAAVGSVLPRAWSLESLSLSCFYAGNDDQANQWCWLEYGLSHPLRREEDLPELMLTVDETGATDAVLEARLEAARRSENPLKSVVHAAIAVATTQSQTHDISCEWYVVGTAVARVIIESIAAFLDPYLRGRPVLDVAVDTKLEAVVRIAQLGVVGAIVRGCGLCWVLSHGVRIECVPSKSEQIQSLALTGFQNPLRPNIGDDLELILRYCPNVATLVLIRYGVRKLQPLVDAYASVSRPCRVTSLVVVVTYGDRSLQQLRARLLLAEVKTTDLLQRIQVCRAIIIPKVLYVARHAWPSARNIRRLQRFVHNYAWHGQLADDGEVRRAWMSATLASASKSDGGLQVPCVRDELLLLSATTVTRWLAAHSPLAAAVGRVLLAQREGADLAPVAPARADVPAPRVRATLASTGQGVLRLAACHTRDLDERRAVEPLLPYAGRAPLSEGWWTDGAGIAATSRDTVASWTRLLGSSTRFSAASTSPAS